MIRRWFAHKEKLEELRREDARAADHYRHAFFKAVDAGLKQYDWYDAADLRRQFSPKETDASP